MYLPPDMALGGPPSERPMVVLLPDMQLLCDLLDLWECGIIGCLDSFHSVF